jgi:TPR repeat protein
MQAAKLTLMVCALALGLAGCAGQPERAAGGGFEAARAAYVAEDFERAFPLMRDEAQAGNAHAQYTLGYMYYNGQGVVPDTDEALRWIRAAAAKGEPRALEALGRLASVGTRTPPPKPEAE